MIWLLIGAFWFVVAAGVGVLVGKSIRRADEMQERDIW
jgi:hypothetical protein